MFKTLGGLVIVTISSKMKSAVVLSLIGAALMVGFQNCGGAQEIRATGGMTQDLKLDLTSATVEQVQAAYKAVLNRLPSSTELSHYGSNLSSGSMSSAQVRAELAQSPEASANVQALLVQAFGSANAQMLAQYQSSLGSTISLADLTALLSGSHI